MKLLPYLLSLILFLPVSGVFGQNDSLSMEDRNKAVANKFYQDLWFTNNTDRYAETVAETYIVHDTGDRKNVQEPALEQKGIADFFWENGTMKCEMDYQVAEGDLVATRWTLDFEPSTFFGRFFIGTGKIPIINVFRIKDGKIVEFWNHRHDIDTPQTMRFTFQGLMIGLLIALIPLIWALRLRRKVKKLTPDT
ncbi:MAG: ester cyclase [Bacteroidota bacterium]